MKDGYLRGALPPHTTKRQIDVLAAFVAAGGSVPDAAGLLGIRPSTAKRHLADLRGKDGPYDRRADLRGAGRWLAPGPESGVPLSEEASHLAL
jgi:predicted ArsR family transcriptional regulator